MYVRCTHPRHALKRHYATTNDCLPVEDSVCIAIVNDKISDQKEFIAFIKHYFLTVIAMG